MIKTWARLLSDHLKFEKTKKNKNKKTKKTKKQQFSGLKNVAHS